MCSAAAMLEPDGTHFHLRWDVRHEPYTTVANFIAEAWRGTGHTPGVALCKESHTVRRDCGLGRTCNCLTGGVEP